MFKTSKIASFQEFFPRCSTKNESLFLKSENWSSDENSDTGLITKSAQRQCTKNILRKLLVTHLNDLKCFWDIFLMLRVCLFTSQVIVHMFLSDL